MTPLADEILSVLPKLRRYSYALIGDHQRGDRYVEIVLETLLEEPLRIRWGDDVRFKLYELFHDVVTRLDADSGDMLIADDDNDEFAEQTQIRRSVLNLPLAERKILLLTIVEGFSFAQAAALAELSLTDAGIRASCAMKTVSRWFSRQRTARAAASYRETELRQSA